MQKIYVSPKDIPHEDTPTRKQFIRQFLRAKNLKTYEDQDCKIIQCTGQGENKDGASRSVTDLYHIVNSRFKTSFEGFVKILREFMEEDKAVILLWCNKVNRVVIKYVNNPTAKWQTDYSFRNYYKTVGNDGLSLESLEKIIKSKE